MSSMEGDLIIIFFFFFWLWGILQICAVEVEYPGEKEMQYSLEGHQCFAISSCWFQVLRHIPGQQEYRKPCCMLSECGGEIELWKTVPTPAAGWGPFPY